MLKTTKARKIISFVFWLHFAVATASHLFVPLIIGGIIKLIIGVPSLGFWVTGLLFGVTFFSAMYAINHISNNDGFCALTDLENFYRRQAKMDEVGRFTPRFYRKCSAMWRRATSFLRKKV